jgi:hypothetical protein
MPANSQEGANSVQVHAVVKRVQTAYRWARNTRSLRGCVQVGQEHAVVRVLERQREAQGKQTPDDKQ